MTKGLMVSIMGIIVTVLTLAASGVYSQGKDAQRLDELDEETKEIKEQLKEIADDFDQEQRQQYEDLNESINNLRDLIIENL